MNLTNNGAHYGATQYLWPRDYELSGKQLVLTGDKSLTLTFRDKEFVEEQRGNESIVSQYEALKVTDYIHLVIFGERLNAAVLDLEHSTAAVSTGEDGIYDFYSINSQASSGALPQYTDDMAGTHAKWFFGCDRYLENTYLADGKCECIWSPRTDRKRVVPAQYIRITDAVYLVELNSTSPFRTDFPQGYSKIIMLQDYERQLMVGCLYSPSINDFLMVSGYALRP